MVTEINDVSIPFDPSRSSPAHLFTDGAHRHQARCLPEITFGKVTTRHDLDACLRLRGRALTERKIVDPATLPDGMDRDDYDARAVHVAAWKAGEIVATGRLVFPDDVPQLPTEAAFDLTLGRRAETIDVGRVVVAREVTNAQHDVLLGLLGEVWLRAEGRHLWVGCNDAFIVRMYKQLGAKPEYLSEDERIHCGVRRRALRWDMKQFALPYWTLSIAHGHDQKAG